MAVEFQLVKRSKQNNARLGFLNTSHGVIETPCFMPVGTQGTVKGVGSEDLEALGFKLILSNTYHLALRPGADLIQRLGGLHEFMSWKGAILTDSGGYQVMSLSHRNKVTDVGVQFRSHLDGTDFSLSPQESIHIQQKLGVDISMSLDVCPPYPCSRAEAIQAMERTHLWAPLNLEAKGQNQSVFGIVQGGVHLDLRSHSAHFLSELPFEGFAIGGVSVGEPTEMQYPVVSHTAPLLPENKPRYLMGVGHPKDIINAVQSGVDMFDCVLPTRMARHHCLYTLKGRLNILNAKWSEHDGPADPGSVFSMTERYSAAYLRHLFKAKESLGARIATLHNLSFYARLMSEIREAIRNDEWDQLVSRYSQS